MIDQQTFFKKYCIDKEAFESAKLDWQQLVSVHDDYLNTRQNLEPTGTYIADRLRKLDVVHSLRIRLKDPEHLLEKIIRKTLENNSLEIHPDNYRDKITDLIGVRALHLFKEDWAQIHDFITENWELHEKPTANVRKGDPEEFIENFKENGCAINEHKLGYRSVHYIVESKPEKQLYLAEVQVRTIFEEGFSEIDHQVRYPYYQDDLILASYLAIFNRLAGSADEMGSFVKILKGELDEYDQKTEQLMNDRVQLTKKLKDHVTKLDIAEKEKGKLQRDLDQLSTMKVDKLETDIPVTLGTSVQMLASSGFYSPKWLGKDLYIPKPSELKPKAPKKKPKPRKKQAKGKPE